MERQLVETFVNAHRLTLQHFIGLHDWKILWAVGRLENSKAANCETKDLDYQTAYITIDYDSSEWYNDFLDTMAHEIFHVLHHHFTNYRFTTIHFMDGDYDKAETAVWKHACEGFVIRQEWLWKQYLRKIYIREFGPYESLGV